MKLSEMFKRQSATSDEFEELEAGIGEVMMLDLVPPLIPAAEGGATVDVEPVEAAVEEEPALATGETRTTAHAQSKLAEFGAFEQMHRAAQADLEAAGAALAKVNAAHHQTREFLNSVYSSIHRANELELAVAKLSTENRSLFRQAEHVKRLKSQLESLTDAFRQRETKLVETTENLRESLAAAKLDLAESQISVGRLEAERQELMNALANATSHSERAARENEVLREKTINLAADLETVSRKRTEAERRLDEHASLHERDAADLADIRSKLVNSETERQRLQKQADALQSKLIDVTESLTTLETEFAEQAQRHDLAIRGLKNERETFAARVDIAIKAEQEASERIAELTQRLNEATDARRMAEERLAAALGDNERATTRMSA